MIPSRSLGSSSLGLARSLAGCVGAYTQSQELDTLSRTSGYSWESALLLPRHSWGYRRLPPTLAVWPGGCP